MLWKTCIHLMFLTCIVHQQSSLRCNSSFLHMSFTSSPLYCRSFVHAEHDLQSCCYVYGQEQTNAYQYLRTRVLPGVLFHQQACPVSNSTVRDATAAAAVTARRRGSHLEPAKIRVPAIVGALNGASPRDSLTWAHEQTSPSTTCSYLQAVVMLRIFPAVLFSHMRF